jgi:glycosyltransferase involved in cell wall biosynthesis
MGNTAYKIIHFDLSNKLTLPNPAEGKRWYYVFWYKNVPLGHIWLQKKDIPALVSDWEIQVLKAIAKSIYYYFVIENDSDYEAILQAFSQNPTWLLTKANAQFLKAITPPAATGEAVSVVICTRNRTRALASCLESLLASGDDNFEIVVVDNAPSDSQTAELVYQKFPTVVYVHEPRKGLDIARNTGAKTASKPIIAYTDDDVIIPKDWISKVRSCFDTPTTMAVTGLVIPYVLNTESQYIFERYWGFNKGYIPQVFDHRYFKERVDEGVPVWDIGAGANMAFRKDIFDLVGFFDERLDVGASGCSGDSEFWYKILAEGWNCVYFPHLYAFHQHRESNADLKKQIFAYMRGNVSSILVQYEKYHHEGNLKRIQESLPTYYKKRIKEWFKGHWGNQNKYLFTEIRGCFSGKKFYEQHQNTPPYSQQDNFKPLEFDTLPEYPLVSVIIPCYNQGQYLKDAIKSIEEQSYQNYEIIVVDDASTDDTKAVCQEFSRVKYVYAYRVGVAVARNIGVSYAQGHTLMFLDADDFLYPNALEINLYYLQQYPQTAFVYGGYHLVDEAKEITAHPKPNPQQADIYTALLMGNCIAMGGTVMFRRALFFRYHFDFRLKVCEDYDIYLKIARDYPCMGHENIVAAYRMHESNVSKNTATMLETVLDILNQQESMLRSPQEKEALAIGKDNWGKYYQIQH